MNRAFVGCCGSGKTFSLQEAARHAVESSPWSILVLDINGEWLHREVWRGAKVRVSRVSTAAAARASLADGVRVVLVRPNVPDDAWSKPAPLAGIADELARVAIESGPTVFVIPEAHQVAREHHKLPPFVGVIAHRWRHVKALVWFDTQNPADVSKELFKACGALNIFAVGGWNDYATLRTIGGPPLESAARALTALARPASNGCADPGWHLRIAPGETPAVWTAFRVTNGRLHSRRLAA